MIAARWRSAILRSAFALRTALVAAVFLSADVFTPTPIFAAEDESSVGGESLILTPSPSLAELGDESFHSLISPTANTAIADTDLLLRHRDSWRRRLGLRTQSAMESLVGTPALVDAMRRLESGDLLLKDFSHRAGNVFFNAAADFSANEIQRLAGLDSIVKRIEIGYDSPLGQHDGSGRADIFLSLWEDHNTLLFGQIGGILQERDNRWEPGGNVGLGLRFQAGPIIFGGNAFFDYLNDDNPGEFRRYSVGLEALTSHADWSINTYRRISDVATKTTNAGTFIVYTAEGWDSEIALRIPGAEWLELAARRYEWERERNSKLVGFDYRLSFLLLESFSLDATFDAPEDGDSDWGVNARFHFNLTDGFRFRRASAESLTDPWHRRYESVRRRYEQRIIEEITILPTPAEFDMMETDGTVSGGRAVIAVIMPLPLLHERLRVRGATSALSANQSGATSALSAQSGATSALSANDFEPNARTCDDSGVCEWRITTVASAGELTAGEIDCVINSNNDGCRIALILSPPQELLRTQDSIIVEVTEAGGFPPPAPLTLAVENAVQFSADSLATALAEGNSAAITITASAARNEDTIITVSLVAGTAATPNTDYQLLDSSNAVISCDGNNNCAITISANATVEVIQITALANTPDELAEAFSLMLIDGSNYALGAQTTFTGGIASDIAGSEAAVQFTAPNLALAEGNAADITVQANAVRSTPTIVTISVGATTDTATRPGASDRDYQLLDSSDAVISCDGNNHCAITIAANAQNEIIQITARLEGDFENVESFSLMLIDGSDYALDTQTTFTGMISSTDGIPFIEFSTGSLAAIAEGDTREVIVQAADGPVPNATIVTISLVADTTATPITDYQLLMSTGATPLDCDAANNCAITISAGAMMESFRISARTDTTAELTEAFSLMLIEDTGVYALGTPNSLTGEITGDIAGSEAAIRFTAANLASNLVEGAAAAPITVQANAARSTPTIVTISLVAGTATRPGATDMDYQLLISTGASALTCINNNCAITISANMTVEVIQITALDDSTDELTEAFSLMLIDDGNAYALGTPNTFGGEITGDIAGTEAAVQFTATELAANLAEGGNADIIVQANAVRNTPTIVTISLVAAVDAATDAMPITDYQLLISTGTTPLACNGNNCAITISANMMMEQIQITAILDNAFENVEAFSLMLINGNGYALGAQTTFTGMIDSTDGTPIIQFVGTALSDTLRESIAASVTVQAIAPIANDIVVTIALDTSVAATPNADYRLLDSGGNPLSCNGNNCFITISSSGTDEIIQVMAISDSNTSEPDEPFSLSLVDDGGPGGGNYDLVSSRDTFTGIITDTGGVHFSADSVTALATALAEGTHIVLTVETDTAFAANTVVTISLGATGDTATPITDYELRDSSGGGITCDGNNRCPITIPAGSVTVSFQLSIIANALVELPESFSLMLVGDGSVYELVSPDTLEGVIASDLPGGDAEASMQFTATSLTPTLAEGDRADIIVRANAARTTPTIVTVSLVATNAAIFETDYDLFNGDGDTLPCNGNNCTVIIPANERNGIIGISALADAIPELAEAFSLMLIDGDDYNLGSQDILFTDEIASDLGVGVNEASMEFEAARLASNLDEGGTALDITVQANAVRTTPTTVTIALVAAVNAATDAMPITDYQLLISTGATPLTCVGNNCAITIAASVTVEVIRITAPLDGIFENVEAFSLTLIDGTDYAVGSQDTFGGNINNRDGTPIIQFVGGALSGALLEGNAEPITVQAIAPISLNITVTIALVAAVDATDATPMTDYRLLDSDGNPLSCVSNNCLVTIESSGTDEIIQVMASLDTVLNEDNEDFSLMLIDDGGPDGGNYDLVSSQNTFTGIISDAGGVHFSTESVTALATALAEGSAILLTVETDTAFNTDTVVTISVGVTGDTATPIGSGTATDYDLRDSSGVNLLTCDGNNNCVITITANMLAASFQLSVTANVLVELSEAFSLMLVDGSDYDLVLPTSLNGVIASDIGDAEASMEFSAANLQPATLAEGGSANITVQANAARTTPTTVTIALDADNAATYGLNTDADADYQLLDSSGVGISCASNNCAITISANATMEVIQITAHANTAIELPEAFSLMLIDGDDYALDAQAAFTDAIASDIAEDEASMQFSTATLADNLVEGTTAGTTNLDVVANAVRTTPTIVTISVGVDTDTATPDDPATADFDGDYRLLDSTGTALTCVGINNCAITISAGAMMERIQITARMDDAFENAESFSLVLVDGDDYALVSTQDIFTGTIDNIDGIPIVQFDAAAPSAALAEGTAANIIVQTTAPAAPVFADTVVTISLVDGTTATPDDPTALGLDGDYRLLDSSDAVIACGSNNLCAITISAGAMMEQIQITVDDDATPELTEAFSLVLFDDGNAYDLNTQNSFGGEITGDITGTEASVQFTAPSLSPNLAEGDAVNVVVRANAVRNTPTIVTISLVAAVDTATDATPITDYQLLDSGDTPTPLTCDTNNHCAITISANIIEEIIQIRARSDLAFEPVESFSLVLVDGGGYALEDTQTTFTGMINSIDGTPIIRLVAASLTGVTEGNAISITVQAIAPITLDIIVTISLGVDTDSTTDDATPMTDYRLFDSDGVTPLTCDTDNLCAITISADETDEVIQIMAITDSDTEEDESFLLTLIDEGDTTYDLVTDNALLVFAGTINAIARVQFSTANTVTIAEGFTSTNLAVSTSAPVESPITITIALVPPVNDAFATPDDPARAGFDGDYALLNSVGVALTCTGNNCLITIAMGEMMAPFQITAIDDASGAGTELAEPFRLTLIDGVTYNLATPDSLTGEIASNVPDGEARMQFSPAALVSNLDEGTTFANIVVRADFPRSTPTIVTISVGVTGNTATPDDPATADFDGDYRLLDSDGTPLACDSNNRCAITLDAAARTETFQIIARLDGDFENVQSFSLVLIRGDDYQLGAATTFTGNIDNEDGTPIIQFAAASLTPNLVEGSAAEVIIQVVTAPVFADTVVTISLGVTGDAATPDAPDADYELLDSDGNALTTCDSNNRCTIILEAGDMEETIQVRAISDAQVTEADESFSLRLIDLGNAYNLGSPFTFTGTIDNVGIAIVRFSTANLGAITEGDSVEFEVTSLAAVSTPTIITISLVAATDATDATPITDYVLLNSVGVTIICDDDNLCDITLPANEGEVMIQVMAISGDAGELAESFSLVLIDGDDYNLESPATSTSSGTIAANPRIVLTAGTATAGERFEITMTFEPPIADFSSAGFGGAGAVVNMQIRGYDDVTDFTNISPSNFNVSSANTNSSTIRGLRARFSITSIRLANPTIVAIMLDDGISSDTIEIRISGTGGGLVGQYDISQILSVTIP